MRGLTVTRVAHQWCLDWVEVLPRVGNELPCRRLLVSVTGVLSGGPDRQSVPRPPCRSHGRKTRVTTRTTIICGAEVREDHSRMSRRFSVGGSRGVPNAGRPSWSAGPGVSPCPMALQSRAGRSREAQRWVASVGLGTGRGSSGPTDRDTWPSLVSGTTVPPRVPPDPGKRLDVTFAEDLQTYPRSAPTAHPRSAPTTPDVKSGVHQCQRDFSRHRSSTNFCP